MMATGAEPPPLAGERKEVLMPAIGVGTTDSGKTPVQVSASQVFLDHFIHHRPKEPVLFLTMLIIACLERFIVVVQDLPQGRIGGLSRMVDR